MRELRFWQVDAFSSEPYKGNPAAIVFDADPLTADEMQTIREKAGFDLKRDVGSSSARWTFPETLTPPGAAIAWIRAAMLKASPKY